LINTKSQVIFIIFNNNNYLVKESDRFQATSFIKWRERVYADSIQEGEGGSCKIIKKNLILRILTNVVKRYQKREKRAINGRIISYSNDNPNEGEF